MTIGAWGAGAWGLLAQRAQRAQRWAGAWLILALCGAWGERGALAADAAGADGAGVGAGAPPLVLSLQPAAQPNQWSLSWPTQPGQRYVLQKSSDLVIWVEAAAIQATGTAASRVDSGLGGQGRTFWRVAHLGGALEPVSVSPVVASYQLAGSASKALLRITTGGSQIIDHVLFFDQGVLLGNAVQGLHGHWTFDLVWDGRTPRPQRLTARVTTEDGLVLDTPVQSFLLADPARFVPLTTNGVAAHGEFVAVDAGGRLAPFLFFPEGTGDAALRTGAHFEFPAGASLVPANGSSQLEFSAGRFYRGHQDRAPLVAGPGTHRISPDDVTPSGLAAALGMGGGSTIDLLWGELAVRWIDGALREAGWSALRVRPPWGDIVLPALGECALVTFDPQTGEPSLLLCFHGEWTPFAPAAAPRFRIPRAEPLKIRLGLDGKLEAQGTVETFLPDGASLRGSMMWREPNFEARFEGRNIVIPAFATLKRALPANPALVLPTGAAPTGAELDAASRGLTSIRDVYRGLAMGGLAEASTGGAQVATAPLAEAVDPVGTALHAWAARLGSWTIDRAGQALDEGMRRDLEQLARHAAKLGEAAHDLPTTAKLLRDVLALRQARSSGVGGAAPNLDAALAESESRLLAATDRLVSGAGAIEPSAELEEVVQLLAAASRASSGGAGGGVGREGGGGGGGEGGGEGGGPGGGGSQARVQAVLRQIRDQLGLDFLARRQIRAGEAERRDNPAMLALDVPGLLKFMEEQVQCFVLLRENGLAITAELPPAGIPLWEAVKQTRFHFERLHNGQTANALASGDYLLLRGVVADRARFFELNEKLGVPLPSNHDKFDRNTQGLLDRFADALEALPNRTRAQYCGADHVAVDRIAGTTSDRGANSAAVDRALALVAACADLLVASSGTQRRCDDLVRALEEAGMPVAAREPQDEGASFPDLSGRYELVADSSGPYVTLQLNQGGRYFKGRMQVQQIRENGSSSRYYARHLEGWFLRQKGVGVQEIGVRSVDPTSGHTLLLRGTATRDATGKTTVNLNGQIFVSISDRPVFGDAVINAFEEGGRDAVRSFNQSPMHHSLVKRIALRSTAARLILDRYYSDAAGVEQERDEAGNLNALLGEIAAMTDPSQYPMARLILRQVLSATQHSVLRSKLTRGDIVGGRIDRSYWELALGVALEYPILVGRAPDMLGIAPVELRSTQLYRYTITVQQVTFPLKAIFGGSELNVTIRKEPPPGSGEAVVTYPFDGFLISAGFGGGAGVTISDTTVSISSPFSYGPAEFEGELRYIQAGAGVAWAEIGLSAALGVLEIVGSGRFPPMVVNLTSISGQFGLAAQVTLVEVGGGMMTAEGSNREPGQAVFGDLVRFNPSASGRFDQAVYFEVDSDVISPCGYQFLREFVAEYRSLFEGSKSFVEIRGLTDRTDTASDNLVLSQQRADRVREALLGLVGPDLAIAPENITAIGLGEGPAAQGGVPDDPDTAADDARWRRVDIMVGGRIEATVATPPGRAR